MNFLASRKTNHNLLLDALKEFKNGNFAVRLPVDAKNVNNEIAQVFNDTVEMVSEILAELTRMGQVVGKEGNIAARINLPFIKGGWQQKLSSFNTLITDLAHPMTEMSRVIGAVASGDLTQNMPLTSNGRELQGAFHQTAKTVNTMVVQLNSFASEVTRVAREVGTEGKLGGQADVKGLAGAGTWRELTENVNHMANNLTTQVRNIAEVTTAVANGDLTRKITVNVRGEILQLKNTINTMVDQLNSFASEVTRLACEVGTEGKLGGQANVAGCAGTWKGLTENVNMLASNLTSQVRNIAEVTTAVAMGDLSKKITVNVSGEFLQLKDTINTMVDQLRAFASEVTRVAREVGTEGKLGGQADVKGVAGTWKDLTDNVNHMANNLTSQVRNIAEVTTAVASGNLTKKITVDVRGEILQLKNTINTMVDQLSSFAAEVTRVAREVGIEGKLGGQAYVQGVGGTWKDLTYNVNYMASNLTSQVRNIAAVTTAVANGDLSKKITVDAKGEILELKDTINIMVDQLSSFAAEVTRVAREVGTEGKLGGQAQVTGVGGIWKDFTDNVNQMALNLTEQVRSIAKVVTAVAQGDLKKKLQVQAKGEVAALSGTINSMIDTLATFAEQVTSVAREVGVEGRLGGQASVPGAAGTWKDLTDNVNQLAANLTNQVRAISKVASAVTRGDLTGTIRVEAQGEVAALKDIINEMIFNLKETTLKNAEQDWLKTNLAKITRNLQGQKDLGVVARLILSELVPMVSSHHGIFYISDHSDGEIKFKMLAAYAFKERKNIATVFKLGEGLVGQCAYEKERILITNVPHDYIQISSGLGESKPLNIVVLPVLFEGTVKAILEIATFDNFTRTQLALLDQLTEIFGIVLNSIETNSKTESLLLQSQSMAKELGSQKEELKQTNEELENKAKQLAVQNSEVAQKNREVEVARRALEEKAEQLALTSKYKSEFLANMSHELRTPLNSLLLLSQHLATNSEGNLTNKQIEYANTISSSGTDLLNLINDILDLSKIESGVATLQIDNCNLPIIIEDVDKMFRHLAESKSLYFKLSIANDVPEVIQTDAKRLRQVLKNFLSNAYKFTTEGGVTLDIFVAKSGWQSNHPVLSKAEKVIAFRVSDTGLGIPIEKQEMIFEAFQQADGTTSRKYGGCGLGLSISREIAILLGGEIRLESETGKGSHFTFYISQNYFNPYAMLRDKLSAASDSKTKNELEIRPSILTNAKDDMLNIDSNDSILLFIDHLLSDETILLAHEKFFKILSADESNDALNLLQQHTVSAIIMDMRNSVLDTQRIIKKIKGDLQTRHIPIYVINGLESEMQRCLYSGVRCFYKENFDRTIFNAILHDLKNYQSKPIKKILFSSDNSRDNELVELLQDKDVDIELANGNTDIKRALKKQQFDCIIVAHEINEKQLVKWVERVDSKLYSSSPIIIYNHENIVLLNSTFSLKNVLVTQITSPELLLDATSLYLHRAYDAISTDKKIILDELHCSNKILENKHIFIIDDDVRNIFSISSVLDDYGIKISTAQCGNEAIEMLKTLDDVDAILMDIMMPDLDGYEATRRIRKDRKFKDLPIIAITAKAMKDDYQKCLQAGATDYLPKPVDKDLLIKTLRLWFQG